MKMLRMWPFLLLAFVAGGCPQTDVKTEGGDTLYPVYLDIGDDNVGTVSGTITWIFDDGTQSTEPWTVMTINDRPAAGAFPAGNYRLQICTQVFVVRDCTTMDLTLPFDATNGGGGPGSGGAGNGSDGSGVNSANSAGNGGVVINVTGNGNVVNTGDGNADSEGQNAGDNSTGSGGDTGGGGSTTGNQTGGSGGNGGGGGGNAGSPPPNNPPPASQPCGVSVPEQGTTLVVGVEFSGPPEDVHMLTEFQIARIIGENVTDLASQLLPCEELTKIEYIISQYNGQTGLPEPQLTAVHENASGNPLTSSQFLLDIPLIPGLLEYTAKAYIRDTNMNTTRVVPWGPVTVPG